MNDERMQVLLNQLNKGTPDERLAAVRELEKLFPGPTGFRASGLVQFPSGEKKTFEARRRRANFVRFVGLRSRILTLATAFLAPWRQARQNPNAEGMPADSVTYAGLMELTKFVVNLVRTMAKMRDCMEIQARLLNLTGKQLVLLAREVTGDDSLTFEGAMDKIEELSAGARADIEELKRLLSLQQPEGGKLG